jgi:Tol biopolymer transport system component/tRNA A-37 threonylcarbamoyl transferase component Bud32
VGLHEGQRLGGYQILGAIGAGGMGEVYRATDTTLGREVAIKVLPEELARDPERLARFRREAHLLASLNHPHVAAIHGLEEADGKPFLVLELVPGEDLATRLKRGPIPVDEALEIAEQMAEALEEAHDKGVVHRDLKPANVKLTPEGQVKVLDFGLAKAQSPSVSDGSPSALSQSPTLATGTQAGTVLGTAAYMSPEQARGKAVDKRADVWAFGVVVYEMLTGRPLFTGETITDVIAAVVTREPDWTALPSKTPGTVRRLLERCLRKDPRWRLPDGAAARLELSEVIAGKAGDAETGELSASAAPGRISRQAAAWGLGLAAVSVIVGIGLGRLTARQQRDERALAFEVFPPKGLSFRLDPETPGPAVISHDGRMLAFTAESEGQTRLYVRPLHETGARALPDSDGAMYPFWSPDSRHLGFFADRKLRRVPVTGGGGPPLTLCSAPLGKGGSWSPEGIIVFAPSDGRGLSRVSDAGGEPVPLTRLDATRKDDSHRHPRFLPDGRHFLFLARLAGTTEHAVVVGSLDGGETKELLRSPVAAEYASGHLLFVREGRLMAQPFDPRRLEFAGEPFPVAEYVRLVAAGPGSTALGVFSASQTGLLAYQAGWSSSRHRLVWRDRDGRETGRLGNETYYYEVKVSPRGDRAAVTLSESAGGAADVWIYDIARNIRTRLTFSPEDESGTTWHPDSASVIYASGHHGSYGLLRRAVDGSEPEEVLHESSGPAYPCAVSPDGSLLAVNRQDTETDWDVWMLPLEGEREPYPFVRTPFHEAHGVFSPDGRWLAYQSWESGRPEVYVTPFPGAGREWQISNAGGRWPEWRQDGKELFYEAGDGMVMAVTIESRGDSLVAGTPQSLFPLEPHANYPHYSPAPDGQRFLTIESVDAPAARPLTVLVNWLAGRPKDR